MSSVVCLKRKVVESRLLTVRTSCQFCICMPISRTWKHEWSNFEVLAAHLTAIMISIRMILLETLVINVLTSASVFGLDWIFTELVLSSVMDEHFRKHTSGRASEDSIKLIEDTFSSAAQKRPQQIQLVSAVDLRVDCATLEEPARGSVEKFRIESFDNITGFDLCYSGVDRLLLNGVITGSIKSHYGGTERVTENLQTLYGIFSASCLRPQFVFP